MFSLQAFHVGKQLYQLQKCNTIPLGFNSLLKDADLYSVAGSFGRAFYEELVTKDIAVQLSSFQVKEDCTLSFNNKKKIIGVQMVLSSRMLFHVEGIGSLDFQKAQHMPFYLSSIHVEVPMHRGNEYTVLYILFKPEHLLTLAKLLPPAKNWSRAYGAAKPLTVFQQPLPTTFTMHGIVLSMLDHGCKDKLSQYYLQVKLQELLLEMLSKAPTAHVLNSVGLLPFEQKLQEAKQFIMEHYMEHYTIHQLAKVAGMNRTSFKLGFHLLFGMGPFELLLQTRMHKALELMKDKDLGIGQIADRVGYNSFASFIHVFKKHYQLTPGQMRKRMGL